MAVVYLAERNGEKVALKVPKRSSHDDADIRRRFSNEVNAHRMFAGRHFARFIDADAFAKVQWLAVEYVAGRTLFDVVSSHGPYQGMWLRSIATDLAEALVEMKRAGVVHRDITPRNIVTLNNGLKVIDFGIARIEDATALTTVGYFFGTAGYAAPERYRHVVTPANDVFSWGACVAFAGTGRAPFEGKSVHDDEPDLDGLPKPFNGLVREALQKDRKLRPTAEEIVKRLAHNIDGAKRRPPKAPSPNRPQGPRPDPPSPQPPEARSRRRAAAVLRQVVLLAVLATAAVALGLTAADYQWASISGPLGAGTAAACVVLVLFGEGRQSSVVANAIVGGGAVVAAACGMVAADLLLGVDVLATVLVELLTATLAAVGLLALTHPTHDSSDG
jgi:serine/threonine protein kinase